MAALPYAHITADDQRGQDCCYQWVDGFVEDAIRVTASGRIVGNTIIDTGCNQAAHRDAIQIIPTGSLQRAQFSGGMLAGVHILDNHIRSDGHLQGIFCSDGMIGTAVVKNNVITTRGQHSITISGLLSGYFHNNVSEVGLPCPIRLYPLRIGGNPDGQKNVWAISFANSEKYDYAPVEDVILDYDTAYHFDLRTAAVNPRDIYLRNFDRDGFVDFVKEQTQPACAREWCRQLQVWAVGFGDQVWEV